MQRISAQNLDSYIFSTSLYICLVWLGLGFWVLEFHACVCRLHFACLLSPSLFKTAFFLPLQCPLSTLLASGDFYEQSSFFKGAW
jgi:hypothetical protein